MTKEDLVSTTTKLAECNSPSPGDDCSCYSGMGKAVAKNKRTAMKIVHGYPWQKIAKWMQREGIARAEIDLGIKRCMQYIAMVLLNGEGAPIALPDKLADVALHGALLHSVDWENLNVAVMQFAGSDGARIHHVPATDQPVTTEMVERFWRLQQTHFATSTIWN